MTILTNGTTWVGYAYAQHGKTNQFYKVVYFCFSQFSETHPVEIWHGKDNFVKVDAIQHVVTTDDIPEKLHPAAQQWLRDMIERPFDMVHIHTWKNCFKPCVVGGLITNQRLLAFGKLAIAQRQPNGKWADKYLSPKHQLKLSDTPHFKHWDDDTKRNMVDMFLSPDTAATDLSLTLLGMA